MPKPSPDPSLVSWITCTSVQSPVSCNKWKRRRRRRLISQQHSRAAVAAQTQHKQSQRKDRERRRRFEISGKVSPPVKKEREKTSRSRKRTPPRNINMTTTTMGVFSVLASSSSSRVGGRLVACRGAVGERSKSPWDRIVGDGDVRQGTARRRWDGRRGVPLGPRPRRTQQLVSANQIRRATRPSS